MTPKPITAARLAALGACRDQVQHFRDRFPEGAPMTVEAAIAVADQFQWEWAAQNLLSATALKAYDEAAATARKAYDEAMASALKAYDEARATARKAYDEAAGTARKAYDEARATAFARAYLNDKG